MGALTWPPNPQRSERPGKPVPLLDPPLPGGLVEEDVEGRERGAGLAREAWIVGVEQQAPIGRYRRCLPRLVCQVGDQPQAGAGLGVAGERQYRALGIDRRLRTLLAPRP